MTRGATPKKVINAKSHQGESYAKVFDRRVRRGARALVVALSICPIARFARRCARQGAPAYAITVIAEVAGFTGGADQSPGNAISFTTTSGFTDVTISALLYTADFMTGGAATVYLTDKIGDGTTTANEIAKVSVTDLPGQFTTDTPAAVFTGLTLPAGTYYVTEASDAGPPGASWGGPASPTETTAPV